MPIVAEPPRVRHDRELARARPPTEPAVELTLDELVSHYERHGALRNTPRTLELNLSIVQKFLDFAHRGSGGTPVPITAVTPLLIESYALERKEMGRASWTINRELGALSVYFGCAVRLGLLSENLVKRVLKLPVVRNRLPRTLRPREVSALLRESEKPVLFHGRNGKGQGNSRERLTPLYDMVLFVLNVGLRLGELLHLEWDDVDLDRGLIHVTNKPQHTLKGRQDRVVRSNTVVLKLLRRRCETESRWVFSGAQGQQLDRANALRELKVAGGRAGLSWVNWLVLRRTFLTRCAASHMPPYVLREIAGHSSLRTTERFYIGAVDGPEWTPPEVRS